MTRPSPSLPQASVDLIIFGGGIAGLWALHRLVSQGYQAILLEENSLGGQQTLASQGVLHGGLKYALQGFLGSTSQTMGAMTTRWKACLEGSGEIDLSQVHILSPYQYLWPFASLSSRVTTFFASKALQSRCQALKKKDYPAVFAHPHYRGPLYQLDESVIHTETLVATLAQQKQAHLFHSQGASLLIENNKILAVDLPTPQGKVRLQAKRYLFTAGAGTSSLLQAFSPSKTLPQMQRRPLHQVVVKSPHLPLLYAVAIGSSPRPPLVVTTHPTRDGQFVWYLGGDLAEQGVSRDSPSQIDCAQKMLQKQLPWVDLSRAEWTSFLIDRAEPLQKESGVRPEGPYCQTFSNALVAWPTKLVMAPLLADLILAQLEKDSITPCRDGSSLPSTLKEIPPPPLGQSPWE